jgi:hypothetical protein
MAPSPKISASGVKAMVVPRRLGAAPIFSSGWSGARANRSAATLPCPRHLDDVSTDSALTTLTPTPCRPPLVA